MSNENTAAVVEINTETLTTPEARDLTIETRKVVHAECHKAEFVVAKATLTERRACVKDFNEGIPKGANERAAFYASL